MSVRSYHTCNVSLITEALYTSLPMVALGFIIYQILPQSGSSRSWQTEYEYQYLASSSHSVGWFVISPSTYGLGRSDRHAQRYKDSKQVQTNA